MEGGNNQEVLAVAATARGQQSEPNQMLNSVVVGRLFELIPFDLSGFKNLRMVSKVWWEASLPKFRKNVWLCLKDKPEVGSQRSSFETFVDWLNLARDPYRLLGNNPFRYYRVQKLQFNLDGVTRAGQKKANFWAQVGPKMKQLELSLSVVYNFENFRRLLFEFTPNLTHLSFKNNEYRDGCRSRWYTILGLSPEEVRSQALPIPMQGNLVWLEVEELTPNRGGTFGTDLPLGCWWDLLVQYPNLQVLTVTKRSVVHPDPDSQTAALNELHPFVLCVDLVKKNYLEDRLSKLRAMVVNNYVITADELSAEDSVDLFHYVMHQHYQDFFPFRLQE